MVASYRFNVGVTDNLKFQNIPHDMKLCLFYDNDWRPTTTNG